MVDASIEAFEVDGHFWLPSNPDKKIAGILTFDRQVGGQLSLIGSFESEDELFNEPARDTQILYGRSEKKFYTLDGCVMAYQSLRIFGGIGRQKFRVDRIFEGVLYKPGEPFDVDKLIVHYTHLLEWSGISGLTVEMAESKAGGLKTLTITSQPLDSQTCAIQGGTLKLSHGITHSRERVAGASVREHVTAVFEFDHTIAIDDALDVASDFQDLLALANDQPVAFSRVELQHPDLTEEFGEGQTRRLGARLYAQWRADGERSKKRSHTELDMCYTFDDLGGIAGVERWMQAACKYRSQLGRVSSTKSNKGMFVQDMLLGRVAALESLHKELHPDKRVTEKSGKVRELNLAERLDDLIGMAGDPWSRLFGSDTQKEERRVRIIKWRERAKDERHNIAHHLGRDLHSNISEMYYVAEAAYYLFVILMLRISDSPKSAYGRIVEQRKFRHSGKELVSFL